MTSLTWLKVNELRSIASDEWIDCILFSLLSVGFFERFSVTEIIAVYSAISITRFVISSVIVKGGVYPFDICILHSDFSMYLDTNRH